MGHGILERDVSLGGAAGVGHQQEVADGGVELAAILGGGNIAPSHANFVRTVLVAIALSVGFVLVRGSSAVEELEQLVVLVEAVGILVEVADANVLEALVSNAVGVQSLVLSAIEIVDHVAAVLAAVEQTGPYQIHDGCHEHGVVGSLDAAAVGVLHEGLQLSHVAGQAVEGEVSGLVGIAVANEGDLTGGNGVDQRHLLHGDAVSSDVLDAVHLVGILGHLGTSLRRVVLSSALVVKIESRVLRGAVGGAAEAHGHGGAVLA